MLRSLGHDVVRTKDVLEEGVEDAVVLEHGRRADRVVITCDRRFTVVDGSVSDAHTGVVYANQFTLQARPEDAAYGVDRLVSTVNKSALAGTEFYLSDWM